MKLQPNDPLDTTSMLLAVLSILDPKAFYSYIASVLLLGIGVSFLLEVL